VKATINGRGERDDGTCKNFLVDLEIPNYTLKRNGYTGRVGSIGGQFDFVYKGTCGGTLAFNLFVPGQDAVQTPKAEFDYFAAYHDGGEFCETTGYSVAQFDVELTSD
jgi:hypothetical protein